MRFQKLRITVGISLVIFSLVVGNVIGFGLLKETTQSDSKQPNIALPDSNIDKNNPLPNPQNLQPSSPGTVSQSGQTGSKTQPSQSASTQSGGSQSSQPTVQPARPVIIQHPRIITRAS